MPLKIVRNDITKMHCDAIVNTANKYVAVGSGCDTAVYNAAGREKLLAYREENIGNVEEGEVFITPAFDLPTKWIIHAVSPAFRDGLSGEEEKLHSCYRKSLDLAYEHKLQTIAFPLISTGSFGYPKEEGMRIAVDEISGFLLSHDMLVYLVVFDSQATALGKSITLDLESYIDHNYVSEKEEEEYGARFRKNRKESRLMPELRECKMVSSVERNSSPVCYSDSDFPEEAVFFEEHESKLEERIKHMSDTFSEYLLYLIQQKGLSNADVYKKAIVDKKVFSKIKNNPQYHPQKMTAMCLCVGAELNLDETKDLLARAGYALSPCDKTDVIFSYFIENKIYDMIELDIQLEEHGQKCLIM